MAAAVKVEIVGDFKCEVKESFDAKAGVKLYDPAPEETYFILFSLLLSPFQFLSLLKRTPKLYLEEPQGLLF